ncbi:MAG: hypothetical protein JO134_00800, partial [Xanthobacteraceae bacterium]|nr:hypothetical protein [Xanthobacteraceae bacterium]
MDTSKTTGQRTIYLSRRFEAADGRLIGIVVSAMLTNYVEHFISDRIRGLQPDDHSDIAVQLFRNDGMLLVRHRHIDPGTGTAPNGAED